MRGRMVHSGSHGWVCLSWHLCSGFLEDAWGSHRGFPGCREVQCRQVGRGEFDEVSYARRGEGNSIFCESRAFDEDMES